MTQLGLIKIDLTAIAANSDYLAIKAANPSMFEGDWLRLRQQPDWYTPQTTNYETEIREGVTSSTADYGERFYGCSFKSESYRAAEVEQVLDILMAVATDTTIHDYCATEGGVVATDSDGYKYRGMAGRINYQPPQNPVISSGGRTVYTADGGVVITFEEV